MLINKTVEAILRDEPVTRNSDKALLLHVWRKLGLNLTAEQMAKLRDMPSAETITRVRRKIQEGGQYQATERIKSTRHHKDLSMQQIAPAATPKYINQTLEQGSLL